MGLLMDDGLIEIRDLLPYENDLLETADRERVEVEGKIVLAVAEIREEVELELAKLARTGGSGSGGVEPGQVALTEMLVRWIHFHSLDLFYFECFGHQMNERYREKWEHYRKRAESAKQAFLSRGVGIVNAPLGRPAKPVCEMGAGSLAAGMYLVCVSVSGSNGAESSLSEPVAVVCDGSQSFVVHPGDLAAGAEGWHVYAGSSEDALYRQNNTAIGVGLTWHQSTTPTDTGKAAGVGQRPDRWLVPQRLFLRG